LGVTTILEGGVQRVGNEIRINVQLIDAAKDELMWAETYTRKLSAENIFVIQTEIVEVIASALEVVLTPRERQDIDKFPTQNLAALEAWFQAGASQDKTTIEGQKEAIEYLKLAIDLDPEFVEAYANLARVYITQGYFGGVPLEERIAKARPLVERAMELDANNSDVQTALAMLLQAENKFQAAEFAYLNAIELSPNNAGAYFAYGWFKLWREQNYPAAVALLSSAKALDPLANSLNNNLAIALFGEGRREDALQLLEEILSRNPGFAEAYRTLSEIQIYGYGQIAESIRSLHTFNSLDPGHPFFVMLVALAYLQTGDNEIALRWLEYVNAAAPDFFASGYLNTVIDQLNGEYEKAFARILGHNGGDQIIMFEMMQLGLITGRSHEVIDKFQQLYPELFEPDVAINVDNFIAALTLGELLKTSGEVEQAVYLLEQSLKVAQVERYGRWVGKHRNWEARIHLALGNEAAALASYSRFVEDGFHSEILINDPFYQPLHDEPTYQKLVEIMESRLDLEREKLRAMEASGELAIPPLPAQPMDKDSGSATTVP
jgi:tetratricopeptide (TPR) repeat protein